MSAPQGSIEWLQERLGCVTASRIDDVMSSVKSGESASRKNYRAQLVAERLTGNVQETFISDAMKHGTEYEPIARGLYEVTTGNDVEQVGFIKHPYIPFTGASSDGLVGDEGLIEIKAPNTATHIDYLLTKKIPQKYKYQMLWNMICTDRKWCDFVSYDCRLPSNLQLLIVRFDYVKEDADAVTMEVEKFLSEVAETVAKLERIGK